MSWIKTELGAEFDKKDTGDGTDADCIYGVEDAIANTSGVGWRTVIDRDEKSHETLHHTDCIVWRSNYVII